MESKLQVIYLQRQQYPVVMMLTVPEFVAGQLKRTIVEYVTMMLPTIACKTVPVNGGAVL